MLGMQNVSGINCPVTDCHELRALASYSSSTSMHSSKASGTKWLKGKLANEWQVGQLPTPRAKSRNLVGLMQCVSTGRDFASLPGDTYCIFHDQSVLQESVGRSPRCCPASYNTQDVLHHKRHPAQSTNSAEVKNS